MEVRGLPPLHSGDPGLGAVQINLCLALPRPSIFVCSALTSLPQKIPQTISILNLNHSARPAPKQKCPALFKSEAQLNLVEVRGLPPPLYRVSRRSLKGGDLNTQQHCRTTCAFLSPSAPASKLAPLPEIKKPPPKVEAMLPGVSGGEGIRTPVQT